MRVITSKYYTEIEKIALNEIFLFLAPPKDEAAAIRMKFPTKIPVTRTASNHIAANVH